MEYTRIDPKEVARNQIKAAALQAETQAFQEECNARETARLARQWQQYTDAAANSAQRAESLRALARAFGDEAGITDDEVAVRRREFLGGWITSLEQNHAGHAAQLQVLEAAGLPDDGHAQVMEQLEVSHEVALGILNEQKPEPAES